MNQRRTPADIDEAYSEMTLDMCKERAIVGAIIAAELCGSKKDIDVATLVHIVSDLQKQAHEQAERLWVAIVEARP